MIRGKEWRKKEDTTMGRKDQLREEKEEKETRENKRENKKRKDPETREEKTERNKRGKISETQKITQTETKRKERVVKGVDYRKTKQTESTTIFIDLTTDKKRKRDVENEEETENKRRKKEIGRDKRESLKSEQKKSFNNAGSRKTLSEVEKSEYDYIDEEINKRIEALEWLRRTWKSWVTTDLIEIQNHPWNDPQYIKQEQEKKEKERKKILEEKKANKDIKVTYLAPWDVFIFEGCGDKCGNILSVIIAVGFSGLRDHDTMLEKYGNFSYLTKKERKELWHFKDLVSLSLTCKWASRVLLRTEWFERIYADLSSDHELRDKFFYKNTLEVKPKTSLTNDRWSYCLLCRTLSTRCKKSDKHGSPPLVMWPAHEKDRIRKTPFLRFISKENEEESNISKARRVEERLQKEQSRWPPRRISCWDKISLFPSKIAYNRCDFHFPEHFYLAKQVEAKNNQTNRSEKKSLRNKVP